MESLGYKIQEFGDSEQILLQNSNRKMEFTSIIF